MNTTAIGPPVFVMEAGRPARVMRFAEVLVEQECAFEREMSAGTPIGDRIRMSAGSPRLLPDIIRSFAQRIFEIEGVTRVSVSMNEISVEIEPESCSWDGWVYPEILFLMEDFWDIIEVGAEAMSELAGLALGAAEEGECAFAA